MKNENGTGSVYKQKGKRRKPWIAVVTIGYDEQGRQKRKSIGTAETKREANELLIAYGKNQNAFSKKLFKSVRNDWWSQYTKRVTHKVTVATMEYRIRALEPLDNIPIADIKLFQLQKLFDEMTFSWSFKNGCKSALNMIYDFALKNDYITNNRVKFIEIGKKEKVIQRRIFTEEEIEILWANKNEKYAYIVLILLYTGMRIGELINLKNEDIDLEKEVIHITESKTATGIRDIPINSKILPLIIKNMNVNQKHFIKGKTTEKINYSTFKPRFEKLLKKLGIAPHTIHDTRHTTATLLSNANANPTSIIRLMGHAKYSTTENIYTHKDKKELEKAINLI